MAISSKSYLASGSSKVFSSDVKVLKDEYMQVYVDGVQIDRDEFEVINNSAVFKEAPSSGSTVLVRVATKDSELLSSLTSVEVVAENILKIEKVYDDLDNISYISDNDLSGGLTAVTDTDVTDGLKLLVSNTDVVKGLTLIEDNETNIETLNNFVTKNITLNVLQFTSTSDMDYMTRTFIKDKNITRGYLTNGGISNGVIFSFLVSDIVKDVGGLIFSFNSVEDTSVTYNGSPISNTASKILGTMCILDGKLTIIKDYGAPYSYDGIVFQDPYGTLRLSISSTTLQVSQYDLMKSLSDTTTISNGGTVDLYRKLSNSVISWNNDLSYTTSYGVSQINTARDNAIASVEATGDTVIATVEDLTNTVSHLDVLTENLSNSLYFFNNSDILGKAINKLRVYVDGTTDYYELPLYNATVSSLSNFYSTVNSSYSWIRYTSTGTFVSSNNHLSDVFSFMTTSYLGSTSPIITPTIYLSTGVVLNSFNLTNYQAILDVFLNGYSINSVASFKTQITTCYDEMAKIITVADNINTIEGWKNETSDLRDETLELRNETQALYDLVDDIVSNNDTYLGSLVTEELI